MAVDRRAFLLQSARLAAWYGVFELAHGTSAWAQEMNSVAGRWAKELGEICAAVRAGRLEPLEWQKAIERLHDRVPLEEIVKFVDLDAVLTRLQPPKEKLGAVQDVPWPEKQAMAAGFGHKLFVYRRGACTPPHAHNHLVSAHLVLKGNIRTRTFDRLADLEQSILLHPTGDRVVKPGQTVSMSDERDNVHWFVGMSEVSVSFDVPVGDISPAKQYRHPAEAMNQIFLDPTVPARSDGRIEAPIIPFKESVKRFA